MSLPPWGSRRGRTAPAGPLLGGEVLASIRRRDRGPILEAGQELETVRARQQEVEQPRRGGRRPATRSASSVSPRSRGGNRARRRRGTRRWAVGSSSTTRSAAPPPPAPARREARPRRAFAADGTAEATRRREQPAGAAGWRRRSCLAELAAHSMRAALRLGDPLGQRPPRPVPWNRLPAPASSAGTRRTACRGPRRRCRAGIAPPRGGRSRALGGELDGDAASLGSEFIALERKL